MRLPPLFVWAAALLLPLTGGFAASYPAGAGNVSQTFDFPDAATTLPDGSTIGSDQSADVTSPFAGVFGNALRLANKNVTNAIGSFKLPDLDPGNVLRSFDLKFELRMEALPGGSAGEGWSVNFGRLPEDNGTGEGGFAPLPRGLTISFDTRDNGEDPTSIQVSVGGVQIGNFPKTFLFDPAPRTVSLHWDPAGLDVTYENRIVCTDLPTPGFSPGVGHRFGFTARSTSTSMDVAIDNLRVTTLALPVIDTGGPVLSEFVANNSTFEDEYADKPGWIEILNGGPDVANLEGWYLTNSKDNLTKWKIQGLLLNPYNYQIVFASGRNLQASASGLVHASFTLDKNSGYLALVKPDGKTVASAYTYGPQDRNVSYGEMGVGRVRGHMFPASPGLVNTQEPSPSSLSPEVGFSHDGGFVVDPVALTLATSGVPGTVIRYTLDRTEPGPTSAVYSDAIPISGFTMVKARTYSPGHIPGAVASRTFVFLDATLTNFAGTGRVFDSNLPFLFLDSFAFAVDNTSGGARPFRPGYAVVVRPDPATGRASFATAPEYAGPCGVHLRGESSAGFDQRSYALELQDDTGSDRDASLLGMPADSDWILYGPWSEKTLMRNKLIFDWMRTLRGDDGMAVRSQFIELFFNQSKPVSGRVGYTSYKGIYLLMEKLKRGKDRVPLANLNDKTVAPDLITGGYIIRKDKDDALKSNWTTSSLGIPLQSFDPDRLNVPQFNYIKGYVNNFLKALTGTAFRDPMKGYTAYIDADTFIDAQWLLEVAKQVDGYVFSTYLHKDRSGRLRAGPLWDFNISLGNADYGTGETPTGWLYDVQNGVGQNWYPRLHADPDYRLAHWDRYWQMRRTILATDAVVATIDRYAATLLDGYTGGISNRAPVEIQNPVARHFRKWPRLGLRDWPNPASSTRVKIWQSEVENLKNWIKPRLAWLDEQSLRTNKLVYRPPSLSHGGGTVSSPLSLAMAPFRSTNTSSDYPDGTLYYTLDGSDPRLPGGAVGASAQKYARPVTIDSPVTVNVRLLAKNQWSPLSTSTFFFKAVPATAANLVISEVLYQPAPVTADEMAAGVVDSEKFEFVELRNRSRQVVDLSGVRFGNGVEFDFTYAPPAARLLRAGESIVVVADKRAFLLRNPRVASTKVVGPYLGQLNNGGETLALLAADGTLISEFRYNDKAPWPNAATGEGLSIILDHPLLNPSPVDPSRWALSAKVGGTPGLSGLGGDRFIGDPTVDTDGDGLSDFFEFATGSDPENPNAANYVAGAIVPLTVNGAEDKYLTVAIRRNPAALGVTFALEASEDLKSWRATDSELVRYDSRESADGTVIDAYRSVAAWQGTNGKSWFVRLRVNPL